MGCSNSKLTADVVSPLPASTAPLVAAGTSCSVTAGPTMNFTSPTSMPPRALNSTAVPLSSTSQDNPRSATLDRSTHKNGKALVSRPSAVGLDQMIESRREEGNLTKSPIWKTHRRSL